MNKTGEGGYIDFNTFAKISSDLEATEETKKGTGKVPHFEKTTQLNTQNLSKNQQKANILSTEKFPNQPLASSESLKKNIQILSGKSAPSDTPLIKKTKTPKSHSNKTKELKILSQSVFHVALPKLSVFREEFREISKILDDAKKLIINEPVQTKMGRFGKYSVPRDLPQIFQEIKKAEIKIEQVQEKNGGEDIITQMEYELTETKLMANKEADTRFLEAFKNWDEVAEEFKKGGAVNPNVLEELHSGITEHLSYSEQLGYSPSEEVNSKKEKFSNTYHDLGLKGSIHKYRNTKRGVPLN